MQLNPEPTSDPQQVGNGTPEQNTGELGSKINPSKTEVTKADKQWSSTMLEMDLQAQNGAIWEPKPMKRINGGTQPQNDEKNEGKRIFLGRNRIRRAISDRRRSDRRPSEVSGNSTNKVELRCSHFKI